MDGKVVKAEIDDIRSRIMIICTELKTRIQFEATENDLFELFSNEQVGLFDDKVRLSNILIVCTFLAPESIKKESYYNLYIFLLPYRLQQFAYQSYQ